MNGERVTISLLDCSKSRIAFFPELIGTFHVCQILLRQLQRNRGGERWWHGVLGQRSVFLLRACAEGDAIHLADIEDAMFSVLSQTCMFSGVPAKEARLVANAENTMSNAFFFMKTILIQNSIGRCPRLYNVSPLQG